MYRTAAVDSESEIALQCVLCILRQAWLYCCHHRTTIINWDDRTRRSWTTYSTYHALCSNTAWASVRNRLPNCTLLLSPSTIPWSSSITKTLNNDHAPSLLVILGPQESVRFTKPIAPQILGLLPKPVVHRVHRSHQCKALMAWVSTGSRHISLLSYMTTVKTTVSVPVLL